MTSPRSWAAYPSSYRAREMAVLAGWIQAGESASLIGLAGSGKSNLLGFLCHRRDVTRSYLPGDALPPVLVLVDLSSLPGDVLSGNESVFYRVVLRALHEARAQLSSVERSLAEVAETLYQRAEDRADPLLYQSALREVVLLLQESDARLVLVLDSFDPFCQAATLGVFGNIRGLRDSFKATLSYIVGSRQELAAVRDPMEMGELYEILDINQCWLGAMEAQDARWVIRQVEETLGRSFDQAEIDRLIEVSGAYPSLLRAASLWLAAARSPPRAEAWVERLLAERSIQYRLGEIWTGLSAEERRALSRVQGLQSTGAIPLAESGMMAGSVGSDKAFHDPVAQHRPALARLTAMGLCHQVGDGWQIRSALLASYVGGVVEESYDEIWLDRNSGELYQGQSPLTNLAPLERELLRFLVAQPLVRHTKTDLILNAWPDEPYPLERSDDSVYQVIRGLRIKIEPDPSKPRYIVTWRGSGAQEGGYQFFPKGR
jgi:hypothetical protein